MNSILELSLNYEGILVILIITKSFILFRYKMLIGSYVNCHEVATLTFGRFKFDIG